MRRRSSSLKRGPAREPKWQRNKPSLDEACYMACYIRVYPHGTPGSVSPQHQHKSIIFDVAWKAEQTRGCSTKTLNHASRVLKFVPNYTRQKRAHIGTSRKPALGSVASRATAESTHVSLAHKHKCDEHDRTPAHTHTVWESQATMEC